MIRVTIAVPEALIGPANQLARVLGEGPADDQTYGHWLLQDAEGHVYALTSLPVSEGFVGRATSPLIEPEWGADMEAATLAQMALRIGDPAAPETCLADPDHIVAVFHPDPQVALALMGLVPP